MIAFSLQGFKDFTNNRRLWYIWGEKCDWIRIMESGLELEIFTNENISKGWYQTIHASKIRRSLNGNFSIFNNVGHEKSDFLIVTYSSFTWIINVLIVHSHNISAVIHALLELRKHTMLINCNFWRMAYYDLCLLLMALICGSAKTSCSPRKIFVYPLPLERISH